MLGFPALPRQVQMQNRLVTGEAGSSDHGVLSFDMTGIPVGPGGKRVLDDLNARVPFDHRALISRSPSVSSISELSPVFLFLELTG